MTNSPHLETTPKTYSNDYVTETPNYDLYPSLGRRLINGYVHQPSLLPVRRQPKENDFTSMTTESNPSNSTVSNQQMNMVSSDEQESQPSWDLYPSILRNVENFGTDQMKQQLHAMETTIM